MTIGVPCPVPILQFLGNDGSLLAGGSVLTQVGGVNAATYQDAGLTTPLPNPIPLNSRGEVSSAAGASQQCFLTPGVVYTFTLYDANGNQVDQAQYVAGGATGLTGSFTGTGGGFTSTPSFPCVWALAGNIVTLTIGAASGTSNADTFTITGLPAAIQPSATTQYLRLASHFTENDGAALTASSEVLAEVDPASGTITLWLNGSTTGWATSAAKGLTGAQTFQYGIL